jgi:hypothetical protein
VSIRCVTAVERALELVAGHYVRSFTSRPRHSRWIASSSSSAAGGKSVTRETCSAAQVSDRRLTRCGTLNVITGVVHAVTYSMLLLNTDLHVAELATRMSRQQFVRNTLNAIQMQLHPERFVDASTPDLTSDDSSSLRAPLSAEFARSPKRSDSIASWSSASRDGSATTPGPVTPENETPAGSATASPSLASAVVDKSPQPSPPTMVYDRAWEVEMESMLKVCSCFGCLQNIAEPHAFRKCTTPSRLSRSFSRSEACRWAAARLLPSLAARRATRSSSGRAYAAVTGWRPSSGAAYAASRACLARSRHLVRTAAAAASTGV